MNNHIESIKIHHILDTDADTSWMGKYSNTKKKWAIDREIVNHGIGRNEMRYFIPANNDNRMADYKRMEALNRGDWYFIGIVAKAKVVINGIIQHLTSGGLWGIESDYANTDKKYLDQIESEQLTELSEILQEIGFTREEILKAQENYETVEE